MPAREYRQLTWDERLADDCRQLVRLAAREDLDRFHDWTTVALVPPDAQGSAVISARQPGVVAGMPAVLAVLAEYDALLQLDSAVPEGQAFAASDSLGRLSGPARSLLTAERPLLNLLGHLSGIATRTQRFVAQVAGTSARIYDTRKTLPGYRRLEKYAVRAGGGHNHRTGLFDGVLIKDNHLALAATAAGGSVSPAQAVQRARDFLKQLGPDDPCHTLPIEIELDALADLSQVLAQRPDIVLLDNMNCDDLQRAVAIRNELAPGVELEASGGVRLETVAAIAATGVDRISVGALTHSAEWLDVGLDWEQERSGEGRGARGE